MHAAVVGVGLQADVVSDGFPLVGLEPAAEEVAEEVPRGGEVARPRRAERVHVGDRPARRADDDRRPVAPVVYGQDEGLDVQEVLRRHAPGSSEAALGALASVGAEPRPVHRRGYHALRGVRLGFDASRVVDGAR